MTLSLTSRTGNILLLLTYQINLIRQLFLVRFTYTLLLSHRHIYCVAFSKGREITKEDLGRNRSSYTLMLPDSFRIDKWSVRMLR